MSFMKRLVEVVAGKEPAPPGSGLLVVSRLVHEAYEAKPSTVVIHPEAVREEMAITDAKITHFAPAGEFCIERGVRWRGVQHVQTLWVRDGNDIPGLLSPDFTPDQLRRAMLQQAVAYMDNDIPKRADKRTEH